MKNNRKRIYPDCFLFGFEPKKNTRADLSQIHFAEYSGIGGGYSDLDYYQALGRDAGIALLGCHRDFDCQRRAVVDLSLVSL